MLMSAYNEDICILVEELLGMNLETLRKRFGRLSLAVVSVIGIQLVNMKDFTLTAQPIARSSPMWIHP